jgi:hypothetical protein
MNRIITLSKKQNIGYFFDPIRQKQILITPEEEVRQQIIHLLVNDYNVPKGLISVEKKLELNGLTRRYDILVHNKSGHPLMLVECKAPQIPLNQSTINQVARYNITLRVPWLLVSNGKQIYCVRVNFEQESFEFKAEIPKYEDL